MSTIHACRGRADLTKFQEEQAAAALGYAAHACALLSVYLDVPLRYPVFPGGSCSFVRDVDATPQPAAAKEVSERLCFRAEPTLRRALHALF